MTDPHWQSDPENPWGHPVWNRFFWVRHQRSLEYDKLIAPFLTRHPDIDKRELIGDVLAPLVQLHIEWFAIAAEFPPPKWELLRDPEEWEDWDEGPIDTSLE